MVREVAERPVRQRPQGRLSLRGDRQPRPADRRPARDALGLRHLPRDAARSISGAPVGTYRVRVYQPGKSDFAGTLRGPVVPARADRPELRPEEDGLLPRRDRSRPTSSRGTSTARRSPNRPIEVTLPDGRVAPRHDRRRPASSTSSSPPRASPRSRRLRLVARLPQDNVAAAAAVHAGGPRLQHRPPAPAATSTSTASRSRSRSSTTDAQGEPTGQALSRRGRQAGQPGGPGHRARSPAQDRRDRRQDGQGTRDLPDRRRPGGPVRPPRRRHRPVRQPDRRRSADLRSRARRTRRSCGSWPTASATRSARRPASTCTAAAAPARPCLTWEADRILTYKLVTLEATATTRSPGPSTARSSPTSRSPRRGCGRTSSTRRKLDIQVERDLRVTVAPAKPLVGPGDDGRARGHDGRPARPARRGRAVDRDDRPVAVAALRRPPAARSARSSTTRPAPAPSRPRPPTRSATRRRRSPVAQAVVDEAERPRPWRPTPPTGASRGTAQPASRGRGNRPLPAGDARRPRRRLPPTRAR